MGFFDEAKNSFIKFSDILVTKTEMYAKIAKLNFDIKKNEFEISKLNGETGKYIIDILESGKKEVSLEDPKINQFYIKIKILKEEIESKEKEIETINSQGK